MAGFFILGPLSVCKNILFRASRAGLTFVAIETLAFSGYQLAGPLP